jgi:hypothetical protein
MRCRKSAFSSRCICNNSFKIFICSFCAFSDAAGLGPSFAGYRVSDTIGEIAAAAAEQTKGLDVVKDSIDDLDNMTQQNSALVEQSAAAAESLKEQARQLAHVVSIFKLNNVELKNVSAQVLLHEMAKKRH